MSQKINNFRVLASVVLLLSLLSCGYVQPIQTLETPEVEQGKACAETISGFEAPEFDTGIQAPEFCGPENMACVIESHLIMISVGYPIAPQVCHEALHVIAGRLKGQWDYDHLEFDYDACNEVCES